MKEEEVEIVLWDWLVTKSKLSNGSILEIYYNRINRINAPTFQTKGLNKKPDFIIEIDRGFGKEFIAVEIKTSIRSKNIHDAGKILDYYERYITGKTKYFIDGKEIKINHFVVASDKSPLGHLFEETEIIDNRNYKDNWRKTNARYHLEPQTEYSLTSLWIRRLWADHRRIREKYNLKEKGGPSLGVLISNFSEEDFGPYLQVMNFNSHLKKPKWGARWWKM